MNSLATLERILRLMILLSNNFGRSASDLSSCLDGVSERSIYRYINILREVGFVVERRNSKYYYIDREESGPRLKGLLGLIEPEGMDQIRHIS